MNKLVEKNTKNEISLGLNCSKCGKSCFSKTSVDVHLHHSCGKRGTSVFIRRGVQPDYSGAYCGPDDPYTTSVSVNALCNLCDEVTSFSLNVDRCHQLGLGSDSYGPLSDDMNNMIFK